MTAASTVLAITLVVFFAALGTAKILAVPPIRQRAAYLGFSTTACRRIGALEVAGAAGVLLGLGQPGMGALAGAGPTGLVVSAGPGTELARWLRRGRTRAAIVRPDGAALRAGNQLSVL
jgi:hypothetical protein